MIIGQTTGGEPMKKEKKRSPWTVIIDPETIPKIKVLAANSQKNLGEYLEQLIDREYGEFLNG